VNVGGATPRHPSSAGTGTSGHGAADPSLIGEWHLTRDIRGLGANRIGFGPELAPGALRANGGRLTAVASHPTLTFRCPAHEIRALPNGRAGYQPRPCAPP
jgi:hypothetical protein